MQDFSQQCKLVINNSVLHPDGISGQKLLLCDESVILPLQIIFTDIFSTSIYPDMWQLANVAPIFKKGNKQLISSIIFTLIFKNQSGFRPGDSTTNQLLYFLDEINQAF